MDAAEGLTVIVAGECDALRSALISAFSDGGAQIMTIGPATDDHALSSPGAARRDGHFVVDRGCEKSMREACERIVEARSGKLVLIALVDRLDQGPLETITLDRWRESFGTAVETPLVLTLGLMEAMLADNWGRIIAIVGNSGNEDVQGMARLTAEAGLIGLVRALASDLGQSGVTANAVVRGGPERADCVPADPCSSDGDFVASAVALATYLAGSESGMLSGQTLRA